MCIHLNLMIFTKIIRGFISAEPDQVILIEAGQFAVFPPEKWHNIEAMTDDTYFNIDFFVAPEVLMEGAQQRKVIHNGK